ncbi:MAG: hypothetical protein KAH20_10300 [Methylococcales bacterium]|nr:hypothetical protein [Methylococcales bacterium]
MMIRSFLIYFFILTSWSVSPFVSAETPIVSESNEHGIALKYEVERIVRGSKINGALGNDGTILQSTDGPEIVKDLKREHSILPKNSIASPPELIISTDRVFAYAEANYPALFPGTATSNQYKQYTYRYYPKSKNYLGIDTGRNIYILGPYTQNKITAVGSVFDYLNVIQIWEAKK